MTHYQNTPEEARRIGWDRLPEHCFGDPLAPYVRHDHVRGTFHFTFDIGGCVLYLTERTS